VVLTERLNTPENNEFYAIVVGYKLNDRASILYRKVTFFFTASRPAPEPTGHPIQWVLGLLLRA